jgi:DUF4097 and DUF4098 domain-containing protein YvlB
MKSLYVLYPQLLVAALLAYLVASGGSNGLAPLLDGEQALTVAHVTGAPLVVDTANGSITVKKSNRADVQITANISAISAERLAAAKIVTTRGVDDTLTIGCQWPGGQPKPREACSFDVEIPDAVGVTLNSENGNVRASNLAGQAHLLTTNGNVEVDRHAGPVRAVTTNGTVTLSEVAGPVKAFTANGAIDIVLARNSAAPIDADGVNSTIKLTVGHAFAGNLSLAATNGSVSVDPSLEARAAGNDPHEMQIAFGNGDQKSSATTINGTVRVDVVDHENAAR